MIHFSSLCFTSVCFNKLNPVHIVFKLFILLLGIKLINIVQTKAGQKRKKRKGNFSVICYSGEMDLIMID